MFYWDDYGNLLRHRRRALRSSAWLGVAAVAVVTWIVPSPLGGDERRAPSPREIRVPREVLSDPLPQHHEMAVPLPGREGARHSPQSREYGWATSMGGRCAACSGPAARRRPAAPAGLKGARRVGGWVKIQTGILQVETAPPKTAGQVTPVAASCATKPAAASMARRPCASSFSCRARRWGQGEG